MSTIPTSPDRLSKATADHILDLVRAYAQAAGVCGQAAGDMSDSWMDRYRQARTAVDAAEDDVICAVLDCVDWRAVSYAEVAARLAAMPAQDGDR